MADWAELPADILMDVAKRLNFLPDLVKFAGICSSWRSAGSERFDKLHPLLLLSYDHETEICDFLDPHAMKNFKLRLPELRGKRFCGSSHGWLIMSDDNLGIHLINPFSRAQIQPPSFNLQVSAVEYHSADVMGSQISSPECKAFLSTDGSQLECLVASAFPVFAGVGRLSFWRPGDQVWTFLPLSWDKFSDFMYYKRKIYAVKGEYTAFVWNVHGNSKLEKIELPPLPPHVRPVLFFVEASEGLLLVIEYMVNFDYVAEVHHHDEIESDADDDIVVPFQVFALVEKEQTASWERLTNIGDRVLVLGAGQSFSLRASEFPQFKANCIYFTDDAWPMSNDIYSNSVKIYDMDDGSITFYRRDIVSKRGGVLWVSQQL